MPEDNQPNLEDVIPGVESEILEPEPIQEPFDPSMVRIEPRIMTMDLLIKRIRENEIDLRPEFQRKDVWSQGAKSRLIESLLIRLPLPAFYVDGTNDNRWLVVDGQQRLTSVKVFAVDKSLRLSELEFLTQFEGKGYDELPRDLRRRIEETQVTVYVIQPGTPDTLKFNVFKRINTGGLPLSSQEIRHALNQGPVTSMLKDIAEHSSFLRATTCSLGTDRMVDREFVLRFIAFLLCPGGPQKDNDIDSFLHHTMRDLNNMKESEREDIASAFVKAMDCAFELFGSRAFRKLSGSADRRKPLNKALFEAWSVNLANISDSSRQLLVERKDEVLERASELLKDSEFDLAITQSTSLRTRIHTRFKRVQAVIEEILSHD